MRLNEVKPKLPPEWRWSVDGRDYPPPRLMTTRHAGTLGDSLVFEADCFSSPGRDHDVEVRDLNGSRRGFRMKAKGCCAGMPVNALFMENPPYAGSQRDWAEARLELERMDSEHDH